jgi:hypothetical protein
MDMVLHQEPAEARHRASGQDQLQRELGDGSDALADGLAQHKGISFVAGAYYKGCATSLN